MSRSIDDVRSLDAGCPALVARATRLSNLYGASLDSRLARKGAGESTCRRRRDKRRCDIFTYDVLKYQVPGMIRLYSNH